MVAQDIKTENKTQVSLPKRLKKWFLLSEGIFVIALGYFLFTATSAFLENQKLQKFQAENKALQSQVVAFSEEFKDLEKTQQKFERLQNWIRTDSNFGAFWKAFLEGVPADLKAECVKSEIQDNGWLVKLLCHSYLLDEKNFTEKLVEHFGNSGLLAQVQDFSTQGDGVLISLKLTQEEKSEKDL